MKKTGVIVAVIFILNIFYCIADVPTRVLQGIQTVPRFDNYLNPEILSLIEKDSMFCMTSDNITDTAQLALTIFYNKEMEYWDIDV